MKGLVADCLKELVSTGFGEKTWFEILENAGESPNRVFDMHEDLDDDLVLKLFGTTCQIVGLDFMEACESFGQFWVSNYTFKHYPEFYEGIETTKEFLLKLNDVHSEVRSRIPNAKPPKLSYHWLDKNSLNVGYDSPRDLTELFAGSVKGVAKHFNDEVSVEILDRQNVLVKFH